MPEQLLIDQCSPTLAGLKTGNMFPVNIEPGHSIAVPVPAGLPGAGSGPPGGSADPPGEGILLRQYRELYCPADPAYDGR